MGRTFESGGPIVPSVIKPKAFLVVLVPLLALVLTACPQAEVDGVLSVTIAGGDVDLLIDDAVALTAQVVVNGDVSTAVTWTSSNESVATIDDSGQLTAIAIGTSTITATSASDPTVFDQVLANVLEPGSVRWSRQFGTVADDLMVGVAVDPDGNVVVVGTTLGDLGGPNAGGYDGFVRKYDGRGNVLWTRQFGGPGTDYPDDIAVDSDGNVVVVGGTNGVLGDAGAGLFDAFVRKYDPDGAVIWTRQFGTAGQDGALGVAVDPSGNIVVVGSTTGNLAGSEPDVLDAYVRKYDGAGTVMWTRQFSFEERTSGRSVATDVTGNILVAGRASWTDPEDESAVFDYLYVRKYDANGDIVWTVQMGSDEEDDNAVFIAADPAGNAIIAGSTIGDLAGENVGTRDGFVIKLGAAGGAVIWSRQIGTITADQGDGVATDADGNVIVVGSTLGALQGSSAGSYDVYVRKYDASGLTVWTRQFGTSASDGAEGVATDAAGNIYVIGRTGGELFGALAGSTDGFIRSYIR